MEEKKQDKEEVLEETKELKKDISDVQKNIEEIQESVKKVQKRGTFHVVLLTCVIILLFVAFALYGFASGIGYGVGKLKEVKTVNSYSFDNVDIEKVTELYETLGVASYKSPFISDKKYTVNDISNDMAFEIGRLNLPNTFSAEDLDYQIDAILGKDYKFTHKSFDGCASFKYSNKTYKLVSATCGGSIDFQNVQKIVGASKNGNELYIYVGVLFVKVNDKGNDDSNDDVIEYYKDYNYNEKVTNYIKNKDIDSGIAEDCVENAKLGTIYKMIFNLEDGNYVFVSSEPMK